MSTDILAAAHDAGGAAAILPILRAARATPHVRISAVTGGPSARLLDEIAECVVPWDDGLGQPASALAEASLRRFAPRVLLTGTSLESPLERAMIRAARREGVASLAVLDGWTNYRARFVERGEALPLESGLPDLLLVIDDFAAMEMRDEGFPSSRLRVVGHPAFDGFVQWIRSTGAREARARVRTSLGMSAAQSLLVFFSQPIAAIDLARGPAAARGYNEQDAWAALAAAVAGSRRPLTVAIKPHPAGGADLMFAPRAGASSVHVAADMPSDELIAAADVVAGMTSIALVKGVLAGRPVISVQPRRRSTDLLVLGRMGLVRTIVDAAQVPAALEEALTGRAAVDVAAVPPIWMDGRATERALALVQQLSLARGACRA